VKPFLESVRYTKAFFASLGVVSTLLFILYLLAGYFEAHFVAFFELPLAQYSQEHDAFAQKTKSLLQITAVALTLLVLIMGWVIYRVLRTQEQRQSISNRLSKLLRHARRESTTLEAIVEYASSGIGIIDLEGNFHKINNAYCTLLGYEREELLRANCVELTTPEYRQKARDILQMAKRRGFMHNVHKVCEHKMGGEVHLDFSLQLLPDKKSFVVIVNSMEEKRQLKRTLYRMQNYFNNSAVGFLVIDENNIIRDVNPYLCNIFGYEAQELINASLEKLHKTHEDYRKYRQNISAQLRQTSHVHIQYEMRKKDGRSVWVELSGTPLQYEDAEEMQSKKVVWTVVDITQIIQVNAVIEELNSELQSSVDFLNTLIDVIPLPIFVKDAHFTFTQVNEAFKNLLGFTQQEILGHKLEHIYSDPHIIKALHEQDEHLKTQPKEVRKLPLHAGDSEIIAQFHKAAIRVHGEFRGLVGVIVDVTAHEEQEKFLQKQVENILRDRLIEQKRHEEERLKYEKFSALGQLSAGITHEINTPLTYIKGNIEMMRMDIEEMQASSMKTRFIEDMQSIQEGVVRISNIIESMREMAGQSREEREKVNIFNSFITALIMVHNRSKHITPIYLNGELFTPQMSRKEEEGYLAYVQRQRIEQVWIVILNNALDAFGHEKPFDERRIDICIDEFGDEVTVTIQDNAGGIKSEMLPKLFEPLTSTKEHSGMGVGLSIAKRIVTEQEGIIRAANSMDGAMFTVRLPRYKGQKD